jgi:ribosome maturation factor RimP
MSKRHDDLWDLIEPWLAEEAVELDDIELAGSGRVQTLKVLVDAEGGVDIDRIAALSDGISRLLDDVPELEGPYQLEVSSPGLERKLTRPRHYEKSVGREVTIKHRTVEGATEVVKGSIAAAGPDSFSVEIDGGGTQVIAYDAVTSARTVFRWQGAPKPGKK